MNVISNPKAESFYVESLKILNKSQIPFMVGGTFALNAYLGTKRPTVDLDIFCKTGDYPKVLQLFKEKGYKTQIADERWLAKVHKGRFYVDVVFNSAVAVSPVTDDWWKESLTVKIFDIEVKVLPPTELIWSKVFVQSRHKYDGNDIVHLFLITHKVIDWKRLFLYMDYYWEVLMIHVLNFRFIYPSEREVIPKWLLDELISRLMQQLQMPTSRERVCRGRLLSPGDFEVDVKEWGFSDLIGWNHEQKR